MNTTGDWQLARGNEVEDGQVSRSVDGLGETRLTVPGGTRGRVDAWKARGLSKAREARRAVDHRAAVLKSSFRSAQSSVRDGAKAQVSRMETSMRSSPMKWAGIAAGTGFALGLIGRIAQTMSAHRRLTPDIIIIEAS